MLRATVLAFLDALMKANFHIPQQRQQPERILRRGVATGGGLHGRSRGGEDTFSPGMVSMPPPVLSHMQRAAGANPAGDGSLRTPAGETVVGRDRVPAVPGQNRGAASHSRVGWRPALAPDNSPSRNRPTVPQTTVSWASQRAGERGDATTSSAGAISHSMHQSTAGAGPTRGECCIETAEADTRFPRTPAGDSGRTPVGTVPGGQGVTVRRDGHLLHGAPGRCAPRGPGTPPLDTARKPGPPSHYD